MWEKQQNLILYIKELYPWTSSYFVNQRIEQRGSWLNEIQIVCFDNCEIAIGRNRSGIFGNFIIFHVYVRVVFEPQSLCWLFLLLVAKE